jgi:putative chitinase
VSMFTLDTLAAAGASPARAQIYLDPLNAGADAYEINTPMRAAFFLSQIAYESEDFKAVEEIWGPTSYQLKYPGGQQYKGRGLIQITGQANYRSVADAFGMDIGDVAAWLVTPDGAARSACWWWQANGCNELADAANFTGATRKVNGPKMLGLQARLDIYEEIAPTLGIQLSG